jgi:hypothetical protein
MEQNAISNVRFFPPLQGNGYRSYNNNYLRNNWMAIEEVHDSVAKFNVRSTICNDHSPPTIPRNIS